MTGRHQRCQLGHSVTVFLVIRAGQGYVSCGPVILLTGTAFRLCGLSRSHLLVSISKQQGLTVHSLSGSNPA